MTHLRPYTPAPLPEFELQLQGKTSMRLEHAGAQVQGAGGLDDAVAFAGNWPPYHFVWMQVRRTTVVPATPDSSTRATSSLT